MKIALISDELTHMSLDRIANIKIITPLNYKSILNSKDWKADFLFVESAWKGYNNKWKYGIATFPKVTEKRSLLWRLYRFYHISRGNSRLTKVVNYAKAKGIPTVFWNKEDGVHFERFIDSAKLFEHIFTVDENCIKKYKAIVDSRTTVNTLIFAVESTLHNFTGFNFKYNNVNFVGSYSHHIHNRRREWQDMMFDATNEAGLQLAVFDRNSKRKSPNYTYPNNPNITVHPKVLYSETAQIYKDYLISLNVNTIEDSPTMFSRRLIEIIACGGVAITNPSLSVDKYFKDYCFIVQNKKEMRELLEKFKKGLSKEDQEKIKAGAKYIAKNHTWEHRLQEISKIIGLSK